MDIYLPFILFPVFFVALWVGVTWLLGWASGWHSLMERYPDKAETASAKLGWQTGVMGGGVNYKHILTLAPCPSGLRLSVPKFFAPFSKPFLVPWRDISVKRTRWFWSDVAEISLGRDGRLVVAKSTADELAKAAGKNWPETAKKK